jgi:hypothetical protein
VSQNKPFLLKLVSDTTLEKKKKNTNIPLPNKPMWFLGLWNEVVGGMLGKFGILGWKSLKML